jgi:hypothetical protein
VPPAKTVPYGTTPAMGTPWMLKPKEWRRAEDISDAALPMGLGLARFGRIDDWRFCRGF